MICIIYKTPLDAVSIVYNLKIAQITRHQFFKADYNRHTGILLFENYRERHDGTRQNFVGGFTSFIYDKNSFYWRVDGAVSHIHEKIGPTGRTFCGTKTDDILFSAGKVHTFNDRANVTFSGLFGIPTHKIFSLQHVDFGTGQVGLGIQCDGIYGFSALDSIIAGGRYLYFVPGTALDPLCNRHRFSIGQGVDLLIAHSHIWRVSGIEYGYTVRFPFGSLICPAFDDLTRVPLPVESSFYFVYKYLFHTKHTTQGFLFNISYAFDHSHMPLTNKYILTLFAAWGISF